MALVSYYILAFIFGLVVGSFLNVCIYRIPSRKSLYRGRSFCPDCFKEIAWYDNIPVVSYLILHGRCRKCGSRISPRYVLVELITALMFLVVIINFGLNWDTLKYAIFITFLVTASFIDIEHRIIPNVLNLTFFIIAISFIVIFHRNMWFEFLISSGIVGGFLLILALVFPKGMGMGDSKFMAVCGLFLGYPSIVALFLGFLIGAIYGLFMIAMRKKNMKEKLSFGPFLALGCAIAIFFGDHLIRLYLSAF